MHTAQITDEEMERAYRALYAEAHGLKVRKGRADRAARGLPNYRPPLGYKLVGKGKRQRVEVDEETAPFVREAFRLAAAGMPLRKILVNLTARGMRTERGNEMSPTALWKILRNPFYVGDIRDQGKLVQGEHVTLIKREVFISVQHSFAR
jgi:DNA invertase Pin-like site-specific DNA recombinase